MLGNVEKSRRYFYGWNVSGINLFLYKCLGIR